MFDLFSTWCLNSSISLITPRQLLNHFFFILKVAEVKSSHQTVRVILSAQLRRHAAHNLQHLCEHRGIKVRKRELTLLSPHVLTHKHHHQQKHATWCWNLRRLIVPECTKEFHRARIFWKRFSHFPKMSWCLSVILAVCDVVCGVDSADYLLNTYRSSS